MLGDCECEDMTASIRDQKISEFLQSVFRSHAAEDGSLRYEDLAAVLASLGRRVSGERIRRIRAKFDRETVEYTARSAEVEPPPDLAQSAVSARIIGSGLRI